MTAAERKLKEAAQQLKAIQREQAQKHAASHARDLHRIDRGDSAKPVKVVGGDEHKSSHNTALQKKLKANDVSTRGTFVPQRTILQRQIAQNKELGS